MKFSDPLILYFKQKSVHNEDADDMRHHLDDDSVGQTRQQNTMQATLQD